MPFIPNYNDATYGDQAEPDSVDFDIIIEGFANIGVLSGCAVTSNNITPVSPNTTLTNAIAVASGTISSGITASATVTAGSLTVTASNSTLPRFDLVVVNTSGTKSVRAGTPSTNPVFPTPASNEIVLAAVYVPPSATTIAAGNIIDKRIFVVNPVVNGSNNVATRYTVVKANDTTVSASTVLVNAGLDVAVAASTIYIIDYTLLVESNTTADLRLGLTFPTGTIATLTDGAGSNSLYAIQTGNLILQGATITAGSPQIFKVYVWASVSTTAGTLGLTFAQSSASGTTILRANSRAEYTTIA